MPDTSRQSHERIVSLAGQRRRFGYRRIHICSDAKAGASMSSGSTGCLALDAWAHARGVKLVFIQPGKPTQNAYIESFNGRFRDECLNDHWFLTLHEARVLIEAWRKDYNSARPPSSFGNIMPAEFAAQRQFATQDSTA